MINEKKARRTRRERVGEVMPSSCLFLIGLSRDGDHNKIFVGVEGESLCAHTCRGLCVCACVCVD